MDGKKGMLKEFQGFVNRHKQWWLLPLLIILILLSLVIVFGQDRIQIPFIYSEF